jgi:hypothetical protein
MYGVTRHASMGRENADINQDSTGSYVRACCMISKPARRCVTAPSLPPPLQIHRLLRGSMPARNHTPIPLPPTPCMCAPRRLQPTRPISVLQRPIKPPSQKNVQNLDTQHQRDTDAFDKRASAYKRLAQNKYHHHAVSPMHACACMNACTCMRAHAPSAAPATPHPVASPFPRL